MICIDWVIFVDYTIRMKPFFSIIIPLYNKEKHIKTTLQSVLNQAFSDYEVIIVNDGSTDNSLNIVNTIKDERIKVYSIENSGVSAARNFGIKKAASEFIAFLDADDLWYLNHLESLKNLCHAFPNCGLYAMAYEKQYYNYKLVKGKYFDLPFSFTGIVPDYFHHSIIDPIAWTSAVVIPKIIFETHGNFDINLKSGQDTDLWIRIALKEEVAFSSEITARRIITDPDNHLSNSEKRVDRLKIIERYKTEELSHKSFKKYKDVNRYSIAIDRKMNGDLITFHKIRKDISPNSLNIKQKLLLKVSGSFLRFLKKIQSILIKNKIYLSAFR